VFYTIEFVYNGFLCNAISPTTLHFVWSRWHLLYAFQLAYNVNSAITFSMQSPRGAVIGKFCSYLACQFKGLKFLACCGPCCPLLKLLLIKKIYHLNTLHLYPAKTNKVSKTNKERVTEFLYHAVQLPTSDCSIFAENEGLVQIKSLYNPSRLWSRLQTTLAQITRIAPK